MISGREADDREVVSQALENGHRREEARRVILGRHLGEEVIVPVLAADLPKRLAACTCYGIQSADARKEPPFRCLHAAGGLPRSRRVSRFERGYSTRQRLLSVLQLCRARAVAACPIPRSS